MKCVFFTIFVAAALMQANSSSSKSSKQNSSPMPSNRLAPMPSFTEQTPAAIQTLDLQSLISSITKLSPSDIDRSLPHLNDLSKILPANSPLGSMIRGTQFLLENQQMLKIFDSTLAVLHNYPTGSSGLNNAGDKTSRASGLHDLVKGQDAKLSDDEKLLLETKRPLLEKVDTSDVEFISESEAHQTNTPKNRGYIVHYANGKIWRTKNTDMIIRMVYNHDFGMIPDEGYTVYVSADGKVNFTLFGDRTYSTYVGKRRVN